MDLEDHRLAGQRMVEIKQQRPRPSGLPTCTTAPA
jgi:hypothetical protein